MYIAMGDSITAGKSASAANLAYPNLIDAWLSQFERRRGYSPLAQTNVFAASGWTSEDLTSALVQSFPPTLPSAKYISIWIGGDDLAAAALAISHGAPQRVFADSLQHYRQDLATTIRFLRQTSRARIVLCTQYNPFPNSPLAVRAIQALNQSTTAMAKKLRTGLAPTHAWFEGRQPQLIYGYRTGQIQDVLTQPIWPIHPNDEGHRVIARSLAPLLVIPR